MNKRLVILLILSIVITSFVLIFGWCAIYGLVNKKNSQNAGKIQEMPRSAGVGITGPARVPPNVSSSRDPRAVHPELQEIISVAKASPRSATSAWQRSSDQINKYMKNSMSREDRLRAYYLIKFEWVQLAPPDIAIACFEQLRSVEELSEGQMIIDSQLAELRSSRKTTNSPAR